MGPAPNAVAATTTTATTTKRQSCDRCHIQKLRCSRSNNSGTDECDRCLRKGAPCSYSSRLPKGRPSLYRLGDVPAAFKAPEETPPKPSNFPATTPSTPVTPAIPHFLPFSNSTQGTHGPRITSSQVVYAGVDAMADVDMDIGSNSTFGNNTDLYGAETFTMPPSRDMLADFQTSWRLPEDFMRGNTLDWRQDSTSDWNPNTNTLFDGSANFSGPFTSGSDGTYAGIKEGASQGNFVENRLGHEVDHEENSSMSSHSSHSGVVSTADNNGVELSIAHLSRLSMRLSQLLLSKCFLAATLDPSRQSEDHDPECDDQPIIEAVFKSINSWLVHGSPGTQLSLDPEPLRETRTTGDMLHHVFSASNHLLEILQYLQVSVVASTFSPSTAHSMLSTSSQSSGSLAETMTGYTSNASHTSQHSYTVIHNLVLACVTLLLNIYVLILIALQRSADGLGSSSPTANLAEPSDHMDAASRGHVKLVSVVQLCSYFIKRQNRAMETFLSDKGSMHAPLSQDRDTQQSMASDATFSHAIEEMNTLKIKVEQRLERLQESLCISA